MFTIDIPTFLKKKSNTFGSIISLLISDLYKENKYANILFVRTCTTGSWLDKLLIKNNVDRILYYTDIIKGPTTSHPSTKIIHSNDLEHQLLSLHKTFDLICIDTWHEYDVSLRDFKILSSFLNDTGLLLSHDCYPWNKQVAHSHFVPGNWCGETYIALIEFAYHHPTLFYSILNIDTGIGIISKVPLPFLSNALDRTKQEQLLLLHKNSEDAYTYFIEHAHDMIHAISP